MIHKLMFMTSQLLPQLFSDRGFCTTCHRQC